MYEYSTVRNNNNNNINFLPTKSYTFQYINTNVLRTFIYAHTHTRFLISPTRHILLIRKTHKRIKLHFLNILCVFLLLRARLRLVVGVGELALHFVLKEGLKKRIWKPNIPQFPQKTNLNELQCESLLTVKSYLHTVKLQ